MVDELTRIVMFLTDDEKALLFNRNCHDWEVYPAAIIAEDVRIPIKRVRLAQRSLRDKGLFKYGTLHSLDENGRRCGSGYWLTRLGELVVKEIS